MMMRLPEQAIRTLDELKAMNFKISVDDFGTGYSSLAYLKRFPIDKLKIDRLFVKDVPDNAEDVAIVRGVIAMAHELGLKVVAEGVERDDQREFLTLHGCDLLQGYLLGRPMPVGEFERLFE
jgi:EAL domain-containing protein (putative c-di-GMP-specific phosphodiesterase class I)